MSSIARAAIGKSVKSSATIYTRRWKQWCDYCENANISPLPAVGYDVATPENIISMIASLCDPDANNQADGTPLRASTADQIHSALKHHYWLKHNCQDNWVCNVSSGKWEGNPCSHPDVLKYVKALKALEKRSGVATKRARAITYTDLEQLDAFLKSGECKYHQAVKNYIQTVVVLAWFLMLRINEVFKIEHGALDGRRTVGPHLVHAIRIPFRKTSPNDNQGKPYMLNDRDDEPACRPLTLLESWIRTKAALIGRDNFEGNERLFPLMILPKRNPSGLPTFNYTSPMNEESFMKIFSMTLRDAKIQGKRTGHCFRRGGAQHRFIHASPRWNLTALRWWGDWESVDMVITYLFQCMEEIEGYYGDSALPTSRPRSLQDEDQLETLRCEISGIKSTIGNLPLIFQQLLLQQNVHVRPSPSAHRDGECRSSSLDNEVAEDHLAHRDEGRRSSNLEDEFPCSELEVQGAVRPEEVQGAVRPDAAGVRKSSFEAANIAVDLAPTRCLPQLRKGKGSTKNSWIREGELHYEAIFRLWNEGDSRAGYPYPLSDERSAPVNRSEQKVFSTRKALVDEIKLFGGLDGFKHEYIAKICNGDEAAWRALSFTSLRDETQKCRVARNYLKKTAKRARRGVSAGTSQMIEENNDREEEDEPEMLPTKRRRKA